MSFFTKRPGAAGALTIALLTALGCSKSSPTPPTDFGVNITVDASALSASQRSMVKVGSLLVSGAESLSKQFDVSSAIASGKLTFQFVPTATSGVLSFEFDAIDATGAMWGSGTAGPVTLNPTGAVAVTITLVAKPGTSKAAGATCTVGTECASTFCTDGVCCQEACKDTCASCALTSTRGICIGYPDGTDPENECAGSSMTSGQAGAGGAGGKAGGGGAGGKAGDGGAGGKAGAAGAAGGAGTTRDASASDAEEINPPDGGIVAMPATCGGKCNGMKACASFAKEGTSCGTPFCNTRRDVASPLCDGKGTCGISLADCTGGYACNELAKPAMCHTNCNSNSDCTAGFYCNGTTSMCAPVKVDSLTCTTDAECLHNHCVTGVCCNTACASPFTCNDNGSAGTCKCPGVATCATGVSCAVFYPDADGDGYGDKTASLATSTAKAACADSSQPGFVLDNTDCDDHDANVHPGQTAFFATASNGTKTFDYDCDGTFQKGLPEYPGATCTFCPGCSACGPGSTTCSSANAQASLACKVEGGICLTTLDREPGATLLMSVLPAAAVGTSPPIVIRLACCGCDDYTGFTSTVSCGVAAPLYTCGTCAAAGGGVTGTTSVSTKQTCH